MTDVFWLPSWYPSIESPQNGDFIYRHGLSCSSLANIKLLFVQSTSQVNKLKILKRNNPNFTEQVVLFPSHKLRCINFIYYLYYSRQFFKRLYHRNSLPQIVHVHVSYKAGIIALWLKYKYRLPYLITEHWSYFNTQNANSFSKSNFVKKFLFRLIFKNAAGVIPVSSNLGDHLRSFFPDITTTIIPNVVDCELFNFGKQCAPKSVFKFIHVSSMAPLKNPLSIIRTFNKLRLKYTYLELVLIGPITQSLIEQLTIEQQLNDSIHIKGSVSHDLVASEMQKSNASILFSQYENLPCVVAESLCSGVPVISSAVGGIPEMLDEFNGILVPSGDEEALYNAMEAMVLNYAQFDRKKISEDAQAKYNPEIVGRQIVAVYEKVLLNK